MYAIVGVVVGAQLLRRRDLAKVATEREERLCERRQTAYAEFYAITFDLAAVALADLEVGISRDVPKECLHESRRLRAVIGLLGPEAVSHRAESLLAAVSDLLSRANDSAARQTVPKLASDMRRRMDALLRSMQGAIGEHDTPLMEALPPQNHERRHADQPARAKPH